MVLVLCTSSDNTLYFCAKLNENISYGFKIMGSYKRMLELFAGREVGREIRAAIG